MEHMVNNTCWRRVLLAVWLGLWGTVPAAAQSDLGAAVRRFALAPALAHASVSVSVIDVQSGRTLAAFDPGRAVAPASSLKVLTTATALGVLGYNHRFVTQLAYDGHIDAQGVLRGNLYLVGSGDPTLGSPELEGAVPLPSLLARWRAAVQQAGIRRIAGQVLADVGRFGADAVGATWPWVDLGNYYGAGAWGLNLHDNFYYLHLRQTSRVGDTPAVAKVTPAVPGLRWTNNLRSAPAHTGDNAYIYGGPYSYERILEGTIPVGKGQFTIKGSVPNAPLFAVQQLSAALEEAGIGQSAPPAVLPPGPPPAGNSRTLLHVHYSQPLSDIVTRTNFASVNLYAEALLRAVAVYRGRAGTAADGLVVAREFWEAKGISWEGVHLSDGSGLSPANALPAHVLAHVLRASYLDPAIRDAFYRSLPLAGRSGTMRNALKGTAAEGRLRAKSGSIGGVRSYTGYAPAANGRLLAFSVLVRHYEGGSSAIRQQLLSLMQALCE